MFKHSLWMVPGVKEGKALKEKLENDFTFRQFEIINICGNEEINKTPEELESFIKEKIHNVESGFSNKLGTITISCGKMTRGATIPQWTACLLLSGSAEGSTASNYFQTIFRVQSVWDEYTKMNPMPVGEYKSIGYVFDFAPERTLEFISSISQSNKNKKVPDSQIAKEILNYLPIISLKGSEFKEYSPESLFREIKELKARKVVECGFDSNFLIKPNFLDYLTDNKRNTLTRVEGALKGDIDDLKANEIKLNENGTGKKETKPNRNNFFNPDNNNTEKKKNNKEVNRIRNIIRCIMTKIPLLLFGISYRYEVHIEELTDKIDDASWEDFMPKGVSKNDFKEIIPFIDPDIFVEATKKQIDKINEIKQIPVLEDRINALINLFSKFKNPDKETILTPWNVVNMHICKTFGGYSWFDSSKIKLDTPTFIYNEDITRKAYCDINKTFLDVEGKTGLYSLHIIYTLYKCFKDLKEFSDKTETDILNYIVNNSIFILCKSVLAMKIVKKVLSFLNVNEEYIHANYIGNIINRLKTEHESVINELYIIFNKEKEMKFDFVIGNPPYQISKDTKNIDVWPEFVKLANEVGDNVSLIHPGRWVVPKEQMKKVHENIINSGLKHFDLYTDEIFKNTSIDGGITITQFEKGYNGDITYTVNGENKKEFKEGEKFLTNCFEQEIWNKMSPEVLNVKSIYDRKMGNEGSLGGCFGVKKENIVKNLRSSSDGMKEPINIWANASFGKGGDSKYKWYFIEKSILEKVPQIIFQNKKIMIDKKGNAIKNKKGNIINNIPQIVSKNSIGCDVFFILPEHDTDYELNLIKSLFMTKTARFLMSITQKDLCVRGFENIPDYTYFMDDLKGHFLQMSIFIKNLILVKS